MGMSSDPLDELLQSWQPGGRLPGNFQAEVWKRVAARSREAVPPIRPSRGAWAMVLAAVLFAFLLAAGQVLRWENERWSALRAQYFQSIDPQALAAAEEAASP